MQQYTISKPVTLKGIGVHSGQLTSLMLQPAPANAGITWVHMSTGEQFKMGECLPLEAPFATVLATSEARISTIEHVMAALWACGIANVVCELHGNEAPILDGSSQPIIEAILAAGIAAQNEPVAYLTPTEELTFVDEQRGGSIVITPAKTGQYELVLQYGDASIRLPIAGSQIGRCRTSFEQLSGMTGNQATSMFQEFDFEPKRLSVVAGEDGVVDANRLFPYGDGVVATGSSTRHPRQPSERSSVAADLGSSSDPSVALRRKDSLFAARTFGNLEDLEKLHHMGLARGSSLENTLAFYQGKPINEPRFENEPQLHKMLDLIGDLYLLGRPLIGTVRAISTGHSFNRQVIAHYFAQPDKWLLVATS